MLLEMMMTMYHFKNYNMLELQQIKKDVEDLTGLKNIESRTRKRDYVIARFIYMDLAYWFTEFSLEAIGGMVNRDHSNVVHGLAKLENHLKYENRFSEIHRQLEKHYISYHGRKRRVVSRNRDNQFRVRNRIIRALNKMDKNQLEETESKIINSVNICSNQ